MADDQRSMWWVFDRPIYADGLFWSGAVLGVIFAASQTTSAQFNELSLIAQVVGLGFRFATGLFVVGVVGGSVRNFRRGYRDT